LPTLSPAASIPPSRIREIAALADEHPGTLRLFYGEDTLPTPEFIKDAAKAALDANHTFYAPNPGYPSFRRAIAQHYGRLHGINVEPSEVVVTASGMIAIQIASQATVGPGDSAILISPLWPNLQAAIRVTGAEAIEVPLRLDEHGFRLDLDRVEAALKPNTRLIALASPGNPTGWTATLEDWQQLTDFCERHDLWLLADGVYERIVFDSPKSVAPSPLEIPEARSRTIVVQSFSKAYRMTGWRVGYAIAPPAITQRIPHLQEFSVSHAFGVAQMAAMAAMRHGEEFVADQRRRYERHRKLALARLNEIKGIQSLPPKGAFYVFPRLEGLTDSLAFCEHLVREYRLGLAPGAAFGAGGEGHIRFCFAVDEATLIDALDRFETAWNRYSG
jgi:aspartate/methionine/tyrosine aminotransferase